MTGRAWEFEVAGSARRHELSAPAQAAVAATLATLAPNTQRAYRADFEDFTVYCVGRGACPLPATPDLIADYLAACAEQTPRLKLATLARRLATIRSLHQAAGYADEANPGTAAEVRRAWRHIRRERQDRQDRPAPATTAVIRAMVDLAACPLHSYRGLRDRALLLLGYATLASPGALVALDVADIVQVGYGLEVTLRHGTAVPDGKPSGMLPGVPHKPIAIPYGKHPATCPVRAWRAWQDATGLTTGPAFRPVHHRLRVRPPDDPDAATVQSIIQAAPRLGVVAVRKAVRRTAIAAGLGQPETYTGQSLRIGAAVQLRRYGRESEGGVAGAGGWAGVDTVRRHAGVWDEAGIWDEPIGARLGL